MNFHGAFVGINKYADKNISDLAGAWADATKLWALFSDSVPEIKAQHCGGDKWLEQESGRGIEKTASPSMRNCYQ